MFVNILLFKGVESLDGESVDNYVLGVIAEVGSDETVYSAKVVSFVKMDV